MRHALDHSSPFPIAVTRFYPPILAWLCLVVWLLGISPLPAALHALTSWWQTEPHRLQLLVLQHDAPQADEALSYEVRVRTSPDRAYVQVSAVPSQRTNPMIPVDVQIPPQGFDVQVAARDAQGCVRYGGEGSFLARGTARMAARDLFTIALRPLPAALCM